MSGELELPMDHFSYMLDMMESVMADDELFWCCGREMFALAESINEFRELEFKQGSRDAEVLRIESYSFKCDER